VVYEAIATSNVSFEVDKVTLPTFRILEAARIIYQA
jgi:uncharacterized UPF0146 family protein